MRRDKNFRLSKSAKRLLVSSVEQHDRKMIKDLFINAEIDRANKRFLKRGEKPVDDEADPT